MQLRRQLVQIVFVIALLVIGVSPRASAMPPQPSPGYLDIVLEGPWIYQYYMYGSTPVLVAMAPAVKGHRGPTFTTGTGAGLPAQDVVYAVSFDDKPFPYPTNNGQQPPVLNTGGYPPLSLVGPVTANTKWPQIDTTMHAYYFILPMPNFASNGGADDMKFSSTFGQYSGSPETHTTGLKLHYSFPITKAVLYQCDHADLCKNPTYVESQPNSGTLSIVFTADEEPTPNEIKCDNHVRLAYHTMIQFLDPNTAGLNKQFQYVDLPGQDDNDQYSAICYGIDPQKPGTLMHGGAPQPADVNSVLNDVVAALKAADPEGKGTCSDNLGCAKLNQLADARMHKLPPRFDSILMDDLHDSLSQIGVAYKEALKDSQVKATAKGKEEAFINPFLVKLLTAQALELRLQDMTLFNIKTGKDCKAAQMILQ